MASTVSLLTAVMSNLRLELDLRILSGHRSRNRGFTMHGQAALLPTFPLHWTAARRFGDLSSVSTWRAPGHGRRIYIYWQSSADNSQFSTRRRHSLWCHFRDLVMFPTGSSATKVFIIPEYQCPKGNLLKHTHFDGQWLETYYFKDSRRPAEHACHQTSCLGDHN